MALLIILCVVSVCYLFFLIENLRNNNAKKIIYYSSNTEAVGPLIIEYLCADGDWYSIHPFIELGGGLAPLAHFVGKQLNFTQLIAVEWTRSLCTVGRVKNFTAKTHVVYVRKLIQDYNLPEPATLYCYLSEKIMTEQHLRGMFDGCLLFSLTFKIIGVIPTSEIRFGNWQSPLLVYDFR